MANVVFNIFKSRMAGGDLIGAETAPAVNFVRDSGGSGTLRAMLLCSATGSGNDLSPDLDTVTACKSASGYAEYSASGYPAMASRPHVPQLSAVADDATDLGKVSPPAGAGGVISFGNPDENANPVRCVLIYEHHSDTDDDDNIPVTAFDEGTIVGTNGSAALLPMNYSWGGRAWDIEQG